MHTWHTFDSNNWIEQTFQQNIGHAVLFGNILEHKLTSSSGTRKNKKYGSISLNYNINLEGVHGHSVRILYLRLMPATTFLFYGTRIMLLTCHFIYIFLVFLLQLKIKTNFFLVLVFFLSSKIVYQTLCQLHVSLYFVLSYHPLFWWNFFIYCRIPILTATSPQQPPLYNGHSF